MTKLTIDELAALRGWDRQSIADFVWAGEIDATGATVSRNGVTFIPSALMRFEQDERGPLEVEGEPLYCMRHWLIDRANCEQSYPADYLIRLRDVCRAAYADDPNDLEAKGILMVLDGLTEHLPRKEAGYGAQQMVA